MRGFLNAIPAEAEEWPASRPLAVLVNVMHEAWSDGAAPGSGPMGNPLRPGVVDEQAISWARYGAATGARRLIDVMGDAGITGTFFSSGLMAERVPDVLREIVSAGHTLAAHGWAQEILPAYLEPAAEAVSIARCADALENASGVRPHGWISPRVTPSQATASLLAAAGYAWHADAFDGDLPVAQKTRSGTIVAVPFSMEVNDLPLAIRYGNEPEAFPAILARILDGWHLIGAPRACINVTVHAHVFGRPAGAIAFRRALDLARRCDHAWLTSQTVLAAWTQGRAPTSTGIAA